MISTILNSRDDDRTQARDDSQSSVGRIGKASQNHTARNNKQDSTELKCSNIALPIETEGCLLSFSFSLSEMLGLHTKKSDNITHISSETILDTTLFHGFHRCTHQ